MSFQFDLRENITSLSLVLDLMFDYGIPNITEKATLISLLEKGSYLSRTTDMLTGGPSSSHQRICAQITNQVEQLPANPNAFWKCKKEQKSLSQQEEVKSI